MGGQGLCRCVLSATQTFTHVHTTNLSRLCAGTELWPGRLRFTRLPCPSPLGSLCPSSPLQRACYYPGSDSRRAAFLKRFPDADQHGAALGEGAAPSPLLFKAGLTPEEVRGRLMGQDLVAVPGGHLAASCCSAATSTLRVARPQGMPG